MCLVLRRAAELREQPSAARRQEREDTAVVALRQLLLDEVPVEPFEPVEGALELLEELTRAGIGFAVASCGSKSRVHYILRQLNIHDQFAWPARFKVPDSKFNVKSELGFV